MLKLYGFNLSGNCYKVKLLLNYLNIDYEWIEVNTIKGESRTPDFLAKNLNGKVPLLELENGDFLSESNAILFYLAKDSDFLPSDNFQQAQILQWMFFEQYSHQPYLAVNRAMIKFRKNKEQFLSKFQENLVTGYKALDVMESHLENKSFFVENKFTIADISLFAYTHLANEGEFDLSNYKNILAWIDRIKAKPNYININF